MDDLISRQAAIDALKHDEAYDEDIPNRADGVRDAIITIMGLPSAQPKTQLSTEDTTFDCISRQAVIDALDMIGSVDTDADREYAREVFMSLPSAQPEIIRCKDCEFWQDNNGGYPNMSCRWIDDETPDAEDYCSYAERKGEQP